MKMNNEVIQIDDYVKIVLNKETGRFLYASIDYLEFIY